MRARIASSLLLARRWQQRANPCRGTLLCNRLADAQGRPKSHWNLCVFYWTLRLWAGSPGMQLQYVRASACGKLVITNPLAVRNILETRQSSKHGALTAASARIKLQNRGLVPLNTWLRAVDRYSARKRPQCKCCSHACTPSPRPKARRETRRENRSTGRKRWPAAAAPRPRYEK